MQYLDAMGIEMFVPRLSLPLESEPSLAELPIELRTIESAEDLLPERGQPVGGGSLLDSLRGADTHPQPVSKPAAVSKTPHSEVGNESSEPTAQFQIGFWWTQSGLIVLDSRRPNAALPTDALINNVLIANGLIQYPLPAAEVIRWPLAKGQDASWRSASAMMHELLRARRGDKPAKYCVVWGEACLRSLIPGANYSKVLFKSVELPQLNCKLLCLPEPEQFLRQCQDKASLWQAFNPLRVEFG
jgi:hypothetical protein